MSPSTAPTLTLPITAAPPSTTPPTGTVPTSTAHDDRAHHDRSTAPDGRRYPYIPADRDGGRGSLYVVEQLVHDTPVDDPGFADLAPSSRCCTAGSGVIPNGSVVAGAPSGVADLVARHLAARRAISHRRRHRPLSTSRRGRSSSRWAPTIRDPLRRGRGQAGIDWSILAAISGTGFGRINGRIHSRGPGPDAVPSVHLEEVSDGDIHDPHGTDPAAARYASAGRPSRARRTALFGYNNSTSYVEAVMTYAALFDDPRTYLATHEWEIPTRGDRRPVVPVGYHHDSALPAADRAFGAVVGTTAVAADLHHARRARQEHPWSTPTSQPRSPTS
ncbi:MAG: hypothetical protein R2695_07710 [Acidimicrobiales bacterium]